MDPVTISLIIGVVTLVVESVYIPVKDQRKCCGGKIQIKEWQCILDIVETRHVLNKQTFFKLNIKFSS